MSYPPYQGPPPYQGYPPGAFAYVPAPVMMPYPPPQQPGPPITIVNHHVYPQPPDAVQIVDNCEQPPEPELIDWVQVTPQTASSLSGKALVVGREGWDGSPLWAIRAHHNGDFVPGKLAVKHQTAYIPHAGLEVPVHDIEVLVAPAYAVRWVPAMDGQVPVGAIPAGNTHIGEPLYIGRVRYRGSLTPGKVHPSHKCCYISFNSSEKSFRQYEVLCKVTGY